MANTKSSKKNIRVSARKKAINFIVRKKVKIVSRKVVDLVKAGKGDEALKALQTAYKELDMAAKKYVLHKNAAARKKSSLARQVAALTKSAK